MELPVASGMRYLGGVRGRGGEPARLAGSQERLRLLDCLWPVEGVPEPGTPKRMRMGSESVEGDGEAWIRSFIRGESLGKTFFMARGRRDIGRRS